MNAGTLPERTLVYLRDGAQKGNRNDELLHAACQFRDARYSESEAIKQLVPRARADGLSSHEAVATIHSAFSRGAREQIGPKCNGVSDGSSLHYRRIKIEPAPLPKPIEQSAITFLETVFREGEYIGISEAIETRNGEITIAPNAGRVRTRETWIAHIELHGGMDTVFESTDGLFVRINPLRNANGKSDKDVAAYRHVLVESDHGTKEEQLGAIRKIGLPISTVTDSGDRSVHALVVVDAPDEDTYRKRFETLRQYCTESLGLKVDEKNKNPSRFSRMPGVKRARRDHETNERILGKDGQPIFDNQTLLEKNLPGKPWDEWVKDLPVDDGLPEIKSLEQVAEENTPKPAEIIEGILYKGLKMMLGGPSKARKTWTLMHLALALVTGRMWLGHQCQKGPVLYVNFELPEPFFKERALWILKRMGIEGIPPGFYELNLRGYAGPAEIVLPAITKKIERLPLLSAIVIDPTYKLMGTTRDENKAADIASLMNEFDKVAVQTGASVISAAHFAKGNASLKEAIDRISGSGVFGRDPDSILIMSPLNTEDAFQLEFILRCLPPKKEVAIRWNIPCFEIDDSLNPSDLKKPERSSTYSTEDLIEALGNQSYADKEWQQKCEEKTGMSGRTFYRLKRELVTAKRIYLSKIDGTWSKSPKEAMRAE
jgi:RecA-family ATPase